MKEIPADMITPGATWPPGPRSDRSPNLVIIPAATEPEKCTGCSATIYKVKHPKTEKLTPAAVAEAITLADGAAVFTGAFAPFIDASRGGAVRRDGIGYSHFIDCPKAAEFRK